LLSYVIIALALATATLALLDIYLSDKQKTHLSDHITRWWSWLDDMGHLSFLDLLRQRPIQWTVVALVSVFAVFGLWAFTDRDTRTYSAGIIVAFLLFGPGLIRFTLAPKNPIFVAIRTIAIVLVYIAAALAVYFVIAAATETGDHVPQVYLFSGNTGLLIAIILSALLCLLTLVLLVVAPLVLIAVARLLLSSAELTVRRIVEYPKGPIIAGSIIVGVAAALIKAVSSS
jgi:FtsH-binding integral membrane protein